MAKHLGKVFCGALATVCFAFVLCILSFLVGVWLTQAAVVSIFATVALFPLLWWGTEQGRFWINEGME